MFLGAFRPQTAPEDKKVSGSQDDDFDEKHPGQISAYGTQSWVGMRHVENPVRDD
jgi:hypothetical protein